MSTLEAKVAAPRGAPGGSTMSRRLVPMVIGLRTTTARGWQRAAPAVRVITRTGWGVLAAAIGCWVVSRVTGWAEFAVVSLALLTTLVVSTVFLIGRSSYRVVVELETERVTVGQSATGRVVVINTGSHRLLPARLELPIGDGVGVLAVPGLAAGHSHELLFQVPTDHRAVIAVGPTRSVRGDAFGLLRRVVRWNETEVIYVHPVTVPLRGSSSGAIRDLDGRVTRDLSNSDISLHALRDYVVGDDHRYIHWKSSAKSGSLLVRQFEETRRSHLLIALPLQRNGYAEPDEFELAVSVVASLAVQTFRDRHQLSVVADHRPLPKTRQSTMDALSGVEVSDEAADLVETARIAGGRVPNATMAVLLCGSQTTVAQIRLAGAAYGSGVRVLAIQVVLGSPPRIASVGKISILTVGSLDDLTPLLRQAGA